MSNVIPTFTVRPEGRYKEAGTGLPGCYLVFTCPKCGRENAHGGYYGKPGAGDGHRWSHCKCWPNGYYIKEARR